MTAVTAPDKALRESLCIQAGWSARPKQEGVMTFKAEIAVNAKIRALAENEIDAVSGGVKFNKIVIVKVIDKSTPVLMKKCDPAHLK